jgi:hypothetical protein
VNVAADLLYVICVAAAFADARRRRISTLGVIGAIFAVALAIDLLRSRGTGAAIHLGIGELGLALVALVLLADAVGLPEPIGARLHLGLHSREWAFDRRLYSAVRRLDRLLDAYPKAPTRDSYERWRASVARAGPPLLTRLQQLAAPDDDWRQLAEDYHALYGGMIDRIIGGAEPDNLAVRRRGDELLERREKLRAAYRDRAERLTG